MSTRKIIQLFVISVVSLLAFILLPRSINAASVDINGLTNKLCSISNNSPVINYLCSLREEVLVLQDKIEYLENCDEDFTDNGDGTISDNCRNKQWQKVSSVSNYSWLDAKAYCENLTLGGNTGWRLPKENELLTLLSFDVNPKIQPNFSFGTSSDELNLYNWSADQSVENPLRYWDVNFNTGTNGNVQNWELQGVRCIR